MAFMANGVLVKSVESNACAYAVALRRFLSRPSRSRREQCDLTGLVCQAKLVNKLSAVYTVYNPRRFHERQIYRRGRVHSYCADRLQRRYAGPGSIANPYPVNPSYTATRADTDRHTCPRSRYRQDDLD